MNWQFWKKSHMAVETKSGSSAFNIFDYLSRSGWNRISSWQALRYYERIAPIATGIDMVVDKFKSLQPSVFDVKSKQYEPDSPFVTFLKRPNASQSGSDFFKQLATYYEVTGEVYMVATGTLNKPPLELTAIAPQFIEITMGSDGLPDKYTINSGYNRTATTFMRKEDKSGLRYFNNSDMEMWHVKNFNPNASSSNFHGASVLSAIYYEVEQHLFSSKHNLSLLQKGGRLTGAIVTESVLDDSTFARLKQEIAQVLQGAGNAGAMPLLEGGTKFVEMGKSNRDMDFLKLKQDVKQDIYNRLKIPLPLVTSSKQTMDNYNTALIALYDDAVIPLQIKLFAEINLFIGARFKLKESETLSVDPATIPALEGRRLDNLKKVSDMNILSTNEKRGAAGREAANGGDVILSPSNLTPIAIDTFIADNRNNPQARSMLNDALKGDSANEDRDVMTINERRLLIGLEPIIGGDAIYMPASEIPAIEIEL